ncbi:MAG: hypothetical protein ACOY0S_02445 [Patescibacteria group bacterium]
MITLLHGDNQEASRAELLRLKKLARGEVQELNGTTLDETALIQALESASLFGGEKLVIIENLFSRPRRRSKSQENLVKFLSTRASVGNVILWEDREISETYLKLFENRLNAKLFKIPPLIFQLLDSLRPGNPKTLLTLFEKTVNSGQAAELIFALIVRRVRLLIVIKDNLKPSPMSEWQFARLTSQAKLFTMEKLLVMHAKLLKLEHSFKSGLTPFTFAQLIEQFLIDI